MARAIVSKECIERLAMPRLYVVCERPRHPHVIPKLPPPVVASRHRHIRNAVDSDGNAPARFIDRPALHLGALKAW
eukprot:6297762-Prymnesium_polylepis.1